MLWTLLSLYFVFLVIRGIWHLVKRFWIWLGSGKLVHAIANEGEVSDDVREAIRVVDDYERARKLGGIRGKHARVDTTKKIKPKRPHLKPGQVKELMNARATIREHFLDGLKLGWFQIVMVFFIGSVLGLIIEQIWMLITAGLTESRYGLVWGPFSPLYGVGAVLLTVIMFAMRKRGAKLWQIFIVSMVVGGLLEQACGWAMWTFMGAISWDYSAVPGHITRWVAAPFLVFWGILGLFWYKTIMPPLLHAVGTQNTRRQAIFITLLSIYLIADIAMTLACFGRRAARDEGIPPQNDFEVWVDENYSDEFMTNRFQNMVIESVT